VWLPYWHLDTESATGKTAQKFGQWAPIMDEELFADLVAQAQSAGYVTQLIPPAT
jgi:hypothetical protein